MEEALDDEKTENGKRGPSDSPKESVEEVERVHVRPFFQGKGRDKDRVIDHGQCKVIDQHRHIGNDFQVQRIEFLIFFRDIISKRHNSLLIDFSGRGPSYRDPHINGQSLSQIE